MSCRIAHIADIHYRGLSRHSEFKTIFQAFVDDVKSRGIEHIFVAGDIFHTKTVGISPEYIEQLTWWLTAMAEVAEVHLTLGNHDGALVNLSRQDAISPIVNALKNPKIHLYKKSGTYEFAPGYVWCVFSLFDEEGWKTVKPIPGKINIACYHGPVYGATTETGWTVEEGITVDFFKEFDFGLLGDIHRMQYLGFRDIIKNIKAHTLSQYPGREVIDKPRPGILTIKAQLPWIAYPGSAIQQNYAEDLKHGYLDWDIDDRNNFSVNFRELPNPQPFVTFEWLGDVNQTLNAAQQYAHGSRFRIKSSNHIAQQEVQELTTALKQTLNATEVTFKIDQVFNKEALSTGAQTLARADLRNHDVLLQLIRNYHTNVNYADDVWHRVGEQVKTYLAGVADSEDVARNTTWSLRKLTFDNLFAYGEGNAVNFDNLNGVVGIFGPNRAGKSSIVGSIMYALFNTTDRGSMKNLHVCNVRKPYCSSRAIVNVNGVDYVFERQTTKHESRGIIRGVTALNVFKINEAGEAIDLAGEQRNDTEKVIRGLIGTSDDFLLTSLSAQGEIDQFIQQGSSRRRQILSRFLDLDVFDKMYDMANKDVNAAKAQLRTYVEQDWSNIVTTYNESLQKLTLAIDDKTQTAQAATEKLADARARLSRHSDFTPVSKVQVENQRVNVKGLQQQVTNVQDVIAGLKTELEKTTIKVATIDALSTEHDFDLLKKRLEEFKTLEANVNNLRHAQEKESGALKQQERSLKILDDVPCGDMFPTCKFIKDAYAIKSKIDNQRDRSTKAFEKLNKASAALEELTKENLQDTVNKIQKLHDLHAKLQVDVSNKQVELLRHETQLELLTTSLDLATARLEELEEALKNDENAEVVSLRTEIDNLLNAISKLDAEKMTLAAQQGKITSDMEKLLVDKQGRELLLQKMKGFELIANAFSRKGVPNVIVTSQLPLINAEIAKILSGIVDFTIELEVDEESDWMDIYINYGDSRRLIELASGMEKMMSSIAIRVALINVSSLPKTDMFILDEGFGVLDDAGIEACNRMLTLLKRYFKTVMLISHVEGVKDTVDTVLEITKNEKDAKVFYE
jgi:DNA repair exonuclease SbcCD ATPase subunit